MGGVLLGAVPVRAQHDHDAPAGGAAERPQLELRGFGDVAYLVQESGEEAGNTFHLGQFDLFATSELSEAFSVLAEMVFEADDANEVHFELERAQVSYAPRDYLKLTFGRFHTGIGFYNTAYHHGTWFQTAAGRPRVFAFEDDGGVLPVHEVGVSVSGRVAAGAVDLHYAGEIGNGRDWTGEEGGVQAGRDTNEGKSVNLALSVRPHAVRGLQTGISIYHDRIDHGLPVPVGQTVTALHAVVLRPDLEWLNEAVFLRSAEEGRPAMTGKTFYTQLSRRVRRVRPYARYEYLDIDPEMPLIGALDIGRRHISTLGVRHDVSAFAAAKVQYSYVAARSARSSHQVLAQLAFAF